MIQTIIPPVVREVDRSAAAATTLAFVGPTAFNLLESKTREWAQDGSETKLLVADVAAGARRGFGVAAIYAVLRRTMTASWTKVTLIGAAAGGFLGGLWRMIKKGVSWLVHKWVGESDKRAETVQRVERGWRRVASWFREIINLPFKGLRALAGVKADPKRNGVLRFLAGTAYYVGLAVTAVVFTAFRLATSITRGGQGARSLLVGDRAGTLLGYTGYEWSTGTTLGLSAQQASMGMHAIGGTVSPSFGLLTAAAIADYSSRAGFFNPAVSTMALVGAFGIAALTLIFRSMRAIDGVISLDRGNIIILDAPMAPVAPEAPASPAAQNALTESKPASRRGRPRKTTPVQTTPAKAEAKTEPEVKAPAVPPKARKEPVRMGGQDLATKAMLAQQAAIQPAVLETEAGKAILDRQEAAAAKKDPVVAVKRAERKKTESVIRYSSTTPQG